MNLAFPSALVALIALPVLLAAYVWAQRRRRREAVWHSNVGMIRAAAMTSRKRWTRHIPLALVLLAMGSMAFAGARPQMELTIPRNRTSIMVAIDVSRSMCAVDVEPNRLTAAKKALRTFIEEQPEGTQIGLIAFAGFAEVVAAPTADRAALLETVDGLATGRGTAIGAAILKAVDTIAVTNPDVAPVGPDEVPQAPNQESMPFPPPVPEDVAPPTAKPVSDIVVLLTDGANTRGALPVDAARIAGDRGVRVYPIGFGTTEPTQMVCTRDQLGGDAYEGGGAYGRGNMAQFLVVDEPTMEAVATVTGGVYSPASDSAELTRVLHDLPQDIVLATEDVELAPAFAAFGALALLGAFAAAIRLRAFP